MGPRVLPATRYLISVAVIGSFLLATTLILWDGERDLLRYGAGIALVIAALTYFLGQRRART